MATKKPTKAWSHALWILACLATAQTGGAMATMDRITLPMVLTVSVLGVTSAVITTDGHITRVKLDDDGLGIPLMDRVRTFCTQPTCSVWVEGSWGATVAGATGSGEMPTFRVYQVFPRQF